MQYQVLFLKSKQHIWIVSKEMQQDTFVIHCDSQTCFIVIRQSSTVSLQMTSTCTKSELYKYTVSNDIAD